MALSPVGFLNALKTYYDAQRVAWLTYDGAAFFGMIRKEAGVGGSVYPQPLVSALGTPPAQNLATVQANAKDMIVGLFNVVLAENYNERQIKLSTMLLSQGLGAKSFLDASKASVDGMIKATSNVFLASGLYRSGTGTIGQVGSVSASVDKHTATITLANPGDGVQFEQGYFLEFRTTDGGATIITDATSSANLSIPVTQVDRQAGTVTVYASTADVSNIAATNYINIVGGNVASPASGTAGVLAGQVVGLAGWCPDTAPSAGDSFWGQDRSKDVVRYAGLRFSYSNLPIAQALIQALGIQARESGAPSAGFVSFQSFQALVAAYEGKVQVHVDEVPVARDENGRSIKIGFKYIDVGYAGGSCRIYADRWCPAKKAYLVEMDGVKLIHADKEPVNISRGPSGIEFFPVSNDSAYAARCHSIAQLVVERPNGIAVVQLGQ